jgi:hypothetical protein
VAAVAAQEITAAVKMAAPAAAQRLQAEVLLTQAAQEIRHLQAQAKEITAALALLYPAWVIGLAVVAVQTLLEQMQLQPSAALVAQELLLL